MEGMCTAILFRCFLDQKKHSNVCRRRRSQRTAYSLPVDEKSTPTEHATEVGVKLCR